MARSDELLNLGCFILDRLELCTDEEAHALSHCLERRCDMKLVVLSANNPKLQAKNCV